MIRTNLEKLVDVAVCGDAAHPSTCGTDEKAAFDGGAYLPVRFSGINFTVKVGDPAFDWAGAHEVAPGVAIENECDGASNGLQALACIGNDAIIVSAAQDGKDVKLQGTPGTVTGKTCDGRVLVYFPKRIVERLCVGDRVQVRASGTGLALLDYPDVRVFNVGPRLLKALNPSEKEKKVRIPVAKVVPGKMLGAGSGCLSGQTGDVDIQASSPETIKELSLDQLRLGDLVAVQDVDATRGGPRWHKDAVTVAVVVHGSSRQSGHGPGLNVILTSAKQTIEPIITRKANIAELMGLQ